MLFVIVPHRPAFSPVVTSSNCKSDEYAENDVYNSKSVINLFKDSEVVIDREIPFTLSMNWEFLMKKQ